MNQKFGDSLYFASSSMAGTGALLLLLTSAYILFCSYKFTSHSGHHPSPSPIPHQPFQDFIEALAIFKSNHIKPRFSNTHMATSPSLNSYNYNTVTDDLDVWPVIDDNDVVVLTRKNFSEFIDQNRYVMVMFYAPCCYHSMIQTQALLFSAAAKLLKGSDVVFAVVDASVDGTVRIKYRLPVHPTMHFFVDGVKKYVYGVYNVMTRDAMMTWVKRKMTIGVYNITTLNQDAVAIHISEPKFVLGFLDSLEGSDSEELAAASARQSDVDFYQTASAGVAQLFHMDPQIKRPALIFRLPGFQYRFDGQFTGREIADFVSARKNPPVITFTYKDATSILNNPLKQLWLFSSYNCSQVLCAFRAAAEAYRGKLLFVQVLPMDHDSSLNQISHEFGVTGDAPTAVGYDSRHSKRHAFNGELTVNSIKSFAKDFLEDELLSQMDRASDTVVKLPSQSHASHQLH